MNEERESLADFMSAYCAGDAAAFSALYSAIAPRVHRYLLRLCHGKRVVADDLLQTTFLKLHAARTAYITGSDPVPWLYAIAHRCFLDHHRRDVIARKNSERLQWSVETLSQPDVADAPDAQQPENLAAQQAVQAMSMLPDSQRQALVLTRLEGLSIAQVAAATGSSEGAVKQRIHRAYEFLRRVLKSSSPRGHHA